MSTILSEINDKEIEKRIKENNLYLLGQVSVDGDEIEKLYKYAKSMAENRSIYLKEFSSDLMLSLALVQLAIYEYQEGNYWDRFCEKLNISELTPAQKVIIGKIFLNTIEEYKLFELNDDYSSGKRNQYVENIKAHAFITNNYMKDYYEFLNDFYENNLFRDLSGNIEDNLQDLSDYIKTIRNSDKDTITDEYKSTTKSYKLLKSSRAVIAQCDGDILYQLFYPSLKLIDENFFDGIIPTNTEDRFVRVFIKWINEKEDKNSEERQISKDRKKYSRKPYITLGNSFRNDFIFKLVIPQRNYRLSECDGSINAAVISDCFTKRINLDAHTHLGSYISQEYSLQIDNPISKFEIIINDERFIIDNKDYVLFDSNYNSINRLSKNDDNFLFTKSSSVVRFSNPNCLKDNHSYNEYNYYHFFADENTICYIDNSPLSIIGKYTEEPIFEDIYYGEIIDSENNKIIAGRTHPSISFTIDNNELIGAVICINNNRYSIKNDDIQITDYPNNELKKIISVDISKLTELNDGEYTIKLDIPGKSNKIIAKYLILQKFYYRFDKLRYIDEPIANLKVKINDLDIECVNENTNLVYYNEIAKNNYYVVNLNSEIKELDFKIKFYNTYTIKIPIKMTLHGFSTENMIYGKENNIWYTKISNILFIKLPGAKKVGAYYSKETENVIWGKEIDNEIFQINITPILNRIKENTKERYQYISIRYLDNQLRWMGLFTILRQVVINPYFELEFDINIISINVKNIFGKENAKVYFDVKDSKTGEVVISEKELIEGLNPLPELQREKLYTFIPYMIEVDEFGFTGEKTTLPVRANQGFLSYKNVKSHESEILNDTKYKITLKSNLDNFDNITIHINKIISNKQELQLDRLVKYTIDCIKKNDKELIGRINEVHYIQKYNDPNSLSRVNTVHIGKVRIYNYEIENSIMKFNMETYSNREDYWDCMYYYANKKQLLHVDNTILDKLKYDDAILLDENTFYEAEMKG